MHTSCSSISVLFSLYYVLYAQTAFLPTTISFVNETLIELPIVKASGTTSVTGVTPIPVSTRTIVLAFLGRGRPIPKDEVRNTLIDAELAILDVSDDHPTQRITNDRFEYRRPDGKMLISIKTDPGEEITWMELRRILQALWHYMTAGPGTEETHYQALEFEIEAGGQEKPYIGFGLVWYFDDTKTEVQKRVTLPPPTSLIHDEALRPPNVTSSQHSNETMRPPPDVNLALPGAKNVQGTEIFPIRGTSLSLSFYNFGRSIPAQSVKATLQGATAHVRPYLNGPKEIDPIEDNQFRWVLPLSREAGVPVAVTVFGYHDYQITWRQLFDVLFGLYAFTTTFGTDLTETHYQVLGFKIIDLYSKELGVGTIAYFTSGKERLAKRVESVDHGFLLQRRSAPSISLLNLTAVSNSIVYPVANTNITLTVTFLGITSIPSLEVSGALSSARQKISHAVVQTPHDFIPDRFEDISPSHHVSTNVLAYRDKRMTWKELDDILSGLLRFCQDDPNHERVLVFEIDINATGRGRVGFGTLLYGEADPVDIQKRALITNDTTSKLPTIPIITQPSLTALAVFIPYPVPGTTITLRFISFGSPIPFTYVSAAFTSALRNIQVHVIHHPNDPIPNNQWDRRGDVSKVRITIIGYNGNIISWQELNLVLAALMHFMTGAGEHRCRDVSFGIERAGEIATGYGSVAYYPDDGVMVGTAQH